MRTRSHPGIPAVALVPDCHNISAYFVGAAVPDHIHHIHWFRNSVDHNYRNRRIGHNLGPAEGFFGHMPVEAVDSVSVDRMPFSQVSQILERIYGER